jgi:hypothetical protein
MRLDMRILCCESVDAEFVWRAKLPQSFGVMLSKRLVLVVLAVERHVLRHDLRVHVRLKKNLSVSLHYTIEFFFFAQPCTTSDT